MQAALDAVHAVIQAIVGRVLKHDIANDIVGPPRAKAFLAHLKRLVESVEYVDGIVDPGGNAKTTDIALAVSFVKRTGRCPDWNEVKRVIELRRAARRFRS